MKASSGASCRAPTPCAHAGLEALRLGIPALRALPLLQALTHAAARDVVIEGLAQQHLRVTVAAA